MADYKKLIKTEISKAINGSMGTLADRATYKRVSSNGYDFNTGTETKVTEDHILKMLFGNFSMEQINLRDIPETDIKATIASADIDFEPQPKDQVVKDTTVYSIVSVENRSKGATWVLQLREVA